MQRRTHHALAPSCVNCAHRSRAHAAMCAHARDPSLQAKALGVEDGQAQPRGHVGARAVAGQQEGVEAGVAGGQLVAVGAVPLYDAPKVAQAPDGRAVAAGEELQEVAALVVIELPHYLPQPLDCLHTRTNSLNDKCWVLRAAGKWSVSW